MPYTILAFAFLTLALILAVFFLVKVLKKEPNLPAKKLILIIALSLTVTLSSFSVLLLIEDRFAPLQILGYSSDADVRFKNKTLLVTGDSITESNYHTNKNWHGFLADWLDLKEVKNDGKSGTGLIATYKDFDGLYNRIDTWDSTYGEFDIILVMGNMNDGRLGVENFPLGSFTDAPYPAVQSQYAVLHATVQKLIEKYPCTPMGWIISPPQKGCL